MAEKGDVIVTSDFSSPPGTMAAHLHELFITQFLMWIPFTACTHLEASPPRGFGAPHYLYLQELINTKAPS